jgi:hypothetical protein
MALHKAEKTFSRTFGKLLQRNQMNAAPIVIHYKDVPAPASDFDPNVESSYPALEEKTVRIKALVHFVTARTVQRQFAEIQAGDAIVTCEGALYVVDENGNETGDTIDLKTMQKTRFELNAVFYVQAAVGKDLAAYWSTFIGGNMLSQTFLLRRSD